MATPPLAQRLQTLSNAVACLLLQVVIRLCTLFYNRPLRHYTVSPIENIIANRDSPEKLARAVEKFRKGKEYEAKLVGVAVFLPSPLIQAFH